MKESLAEAFQGDDFSVRDAVGGVRGVFEALLPGIIFVATYIISGSLGWTIGLSALVSIIFVLARLVQKQSLVQALAGLVGVAIGVVWALSTGRAENYYAFGLIQNAVYCLVFLVSILIQWPLVALGAQFVWGLPSGWKRSPEYAGLYRRCIWASWVWVGVFALRLAVTAPLYFSGQIVSLGIFKLVMGLPVFAIGAWFTWILLRGQRPASSSETNEL